VWEDVVDGSEGDHDQGEGGASGVEPISPVDDQAHAPVESLVPGVRPSCRLRLNPLICRLGRCGLRIRFIRGLGRSWSSSSAGGTGARTACISSTRPAHWGCCLRSGRMSPHLTGSSRWPAAERRFGPHACWSWPSTWPSCDPGAQHPVARMSRGSRHDCQENHVTRCRSSDEMVPSQGADPIVPMAFTNLPSACRDREVDSL